MRVAFPPEWQHKLEESSPQSDIYALGVLALQLLLGTAAVEHALSNEAVARVGLWKVIEPSVRHRLSDGSGRYRRWLSRALSVDPARRFSNGRVASDALPRSLWKSLPVAFAAAAAFALLAFGIAMERFQTTDILSHDLESAVRESQESQKQAAQSQAESAKLDLEKEELQLSLWSSEAAGSGDPRRARLANGKETEV